MTEITRAKISLSPCDIHKSKAAMQVMQSINTRFTKFPMVLVTKAGNISLINWCLDGKQPSHIVSTPIASTMHFQLLKEGNDFLLYKMLDLPRMPTEKGHFYGKVLQNQKNL
jgi:hypothetical protein